MCIGYECSENSTVIVIYSGISIALVEGHQNTMDGLENTGSGAISYKYITVKYELQLDLVNTVTDYFNAPFRARFVSFLRAKYVKINSPKMICDYIAF